MKCENIKTKLCRKHENALSNDGALIFFLNDGKGFTAKLILP